MICSWYLGTEESWSSGAVHVSVPGQLRSLDAHRISLLPLAQVYVVLKAYESLPRAAHVVEMAQKLCREGGSLAGPDALGAINAPVLVKGEPWLPVKDKEGSASGSRVALPASAGTGQVCGSTPCLTGGPKADAVGDAAAVAAKSAGKGVKSEPGLAMHTPPAEVREVLCPRVAWM